MGHAGAIISGGKGTAAEKMAAMKKAGITVVESPANIGITMFKVLEKLRSKEKKISNKKNVKKPIKASPAKLKSTSKKNIKKTIKEK